MKLKTDENLLEELKGYSKQIEEKLFEIDTYTKESFQVEFFLTNVITDPHFLVNAKYKNEVDKLVKEFNLDYKRALAMYVKPEDEDKINFIIKLNEELGELAKEITKHGINMDITTDFLRNNEIKATSQHAKKLIHHCSTYTTNERQEIAFQGFQKIKEIWEDLVKQGIVDDLHYTPGLHSYVGQNGQININPILQAIE